MGFSLVRVAGGNANKYSNLFRFAPKFFITNCKLVCLCSAAAARWPCIHVNTYFLVVACLEPINGLPAINAKNSTNLVRIWKPGIYGWQQFKPAIGIFVNLICRIVSAILKILYAFI